MMYKQFSFYSKQEKPLNNILFLYFNCFLHLQQCKGYKLLPPQKNSDFNLYLHIPKTIRIFCFYDWFNTRLDFEFSLFGDDLDHVLKKINDIKKCDLTTFQSLDVDYDVLFFNIKNEDLVKRIDLEAKDRWRF